MKNTALLLCLAVSPCLAQSLTQGERDYAMSSLHATRKMFLDAVDGLSPAQWKFKPAADRWSIAEIATHLVLAEDAMLQRAQASLKSPAAGTRAPAPGDDHAGDEALYRKFADRSQKAKAPAALLPRTPLAGPAAAAEAFRTRRDRTIRYVETTQDDLRGHTVDGMDAYQMLIAIAAHTERHVAQMNEVKASPGYPK